MHRHPHLGALLILALALTLGATSGRAEDSAADAPVAAQAAAADDAGPAESADAAVPEGDGPAEAPAAQVPPDEPGAAAGELPDEPAAADPPSWSEEILTETPALALEGRVAQGASAWAVCSHCHLASGAGRTDGSVPQLAGQHTSVLIKQMTDIRDGRRENPIMYPFARTLIDPQKLADLAAYIETLPIPRDNGKGPGTHLALGSRMFERDCRRCHGSDGQGSAQEFVPVVAGQHYEYLLRQVEDIAEGWRRNNHPDMTDLISGYTREQLSAVVDYMSRLEWPERQQQN